MLFRSVIATGFDESQAVDFPHAPAVEEPAPAPVAEAPAAPAPAVKEEPVPEPAPVPAAEPPKPAVNDEDWDILERIFSKKK